MTIKEKQQLQVDEGIVYKVYLDSLGFPTGGVGHLMSKDELALYPVGSALPKQLVDKWFDEDIQVAIDIANKLCPVDCSDDLNDIITNMAFNMGQGKLSRFKKMWIAIAASDFKEAAVEMKDSLWYRQVGYRSSRLVERMKALAESKEL
jgi:lysozyme